MGIEINCLQWSQPAIPHCSSPSSPQTSLASLFSTKRGGVDGGDRSLTWHIFHQISRPSPFLGPTSAKLSRRRSWEDFRRSGSGQSLRRAFSANMDWLAAGVDGGDDEEGEEFVSRGHELALELQDWSNNIENIVPDPRNQKAEATSSVGNGVNPLWPVSRPEPPNWDELKLASVEFNANRADLPLSLRIIKKKKKKKRWEEGMKDAGESACCSIKKAFSSMVFIVRELQSYTLQMREVLLYENLQGIWAKVQGEMNASFVWLFQQIFSCTPTLMVYVMLLLANFTVYSISQNLAIAAPSPDPPVAAEHEYQETQHNSRFDASSIKSFSVGRTASVGGSGGGGGKVKPVAGATDDGRSDGSYSSHSAGVEGPETAAVEDEERATWHRIVEEVYRMQVSLRGETLMDPDTLHQLVSPISAELEPEDLAVYLRTELMYHHALSQDPDNVLLLSNFAQFLFLVLHDHDRAEFYFKKAAGVKPVDAEALCRYAVFLWSARKDVEGAEDAYLEAMAAADPGNISHYSANYAHFLWNTGGDDTCYPLDGSDVC